MRAHLQTAKFERQFDEKDLEGKSAYRALRL